MGDFTVAIIAGGKSSRMGTDKSFIPVLGKPIIEHILERVTKLGQAETLIIANLPANYAYLNRPVYTDVVPDSGSLGGIYTALYHSKTDYTLVLACDMPFVNSKLLEYMLQLVTKENQTYDVIVPRKAHYPQGTHAIYRKNCLDPIRNRIVAQKLKVVGFYNEVHVRYIDEPEYLPIDPDQLSFFNVNTPEELEEARRLADQNSSSD